LKVLVVGAGVVGVTSAWYLARAGHQVTVLDRQPAAGSRNQLCQRRPDFRFARRALGQSAHPLARAVLDATRGLAAALPSALGYGTARLEPALSCASAPHRRARANMRQIVTLALYSRRQLQALRAETALAYDHLERGILHIYTDRREFATAIAAAALMRDFGCERRTVDVDECIAIEPALARAQAVAGRRRLYGGRRVGRRASLHAAARGALRRARGDFPLRRDESTSWSPRPAGWLA
jgi:D-amino-acid dehydrogenase